MILQFLLFIFKIFISKIVYRLYIQSESPVLWTSTHRHYSDGDTGFDLDLQKSFQVSTLHQLLMNTFIFIRIIRLFNHVLCIIESLLSFKFIKMHKFLLFLADILYLFVVWTSFTWYIYFKAVVNQRFCKRQYLSLHWTLSIITLQVFLLKQQHYTLKLKSEIIINDLFKYPWDFKINILIITLSCSRFSDIG